MGFGALTRIPEMVCAGVPVLAFPHAGFAIDTPPGVEVLADDSWPTLWQGIERAMANPMQVDPDAYRAWESSQPRPLQRVFASVAAKV